MPSSSFLPPSSSPDLICQLLIAVLAALGRSGPRRTSTASSRSQRASPDLNCQLSITAGLAGPQLPARNRCGPRRPQPTRVWALWASPDPNRQESERCGPRCTSTNESLSAVGLAGTQPARKHLRKSAIIDRMSDIESDKKIR